MPLAIISPPLVRPVTLDQIKQHIRIDNDTEDALLLNYCDAATDYIEANISKFLIKRVVRQFVDQMPEKHEILLNAEPVSAVSAVRIYDGEGNPQEILSSAYRFYQYESPPRLQFDSSLRSFSHCNGIEIDMVAGFGESGADLPQSITRALLVLIAHWYEYRGTNAPGEAFGTIPEGLDKLLAPVRRVSL